MIQTVELRLKRHQTVILDNDLLLLVLGASL
jgi:hypothetical protein